MGIKVALEHRTSYTFDRLVEVHPHVVRLRPAPHSRTPIEAYSLQVEPADHFINWQQDAFGNFLARLVFPNRTPQPDHHRRADRRPEGDQPVRLLHRGLGRARSASTTRKALAEDLKPYLRPVDEDGDGLRARASSSRPGCRTSPSRPGTRTIDFLVALNRAVNADVGYSVRMEPGVQTPDLTLRTGDRLLPRLGVAAGVDPAPAGPGRPVRLRLPGAADLRRRGAGRAVRAGRRLHRPARLGRGVHPRRRLDRAGPDVGAVRRRGPHPAVGHAAPGVGGADHRRDRAVRDRRWTSPTSSPGSTRTRGSRCPTPTRRGRRSCALGRQRRRAAGRRRRPAHRGRRADVRLDRQPGRPGVDHRRRRPAQARSAPRRWPAG